MTDYMDEAFETWFKHQIWGNEDFKTCLSEAWQAALLAHTQRGVPEGYDIAPTFRGYAKLGAGHYVLHNCPRTDEDHPSLVIAIATEAEKAGRQVGELRQSQPGLMIQPERIAVRIDFKSVAALDALEQQLRFLREDSFPDSLTAHAPDQFRNAAKMMAVQPSCMTCTAPAPAEVLGETCIDSGKCHHACTDKCFRRECCVPMTQAATDVLAERQRQISAEGWTPEHDDAHICGSIAAAAACYAAPAGNEREAILPYWPWNTSSWKPKSRRSDLVKAGALILAEIERLDRAALRGEVKP